MNRAPFPTPVPGLVIRYSYLWHGEHLQGREDGRKDRPCSIVAAIRADESGATRVLVLPVTHSPPDQARFAVEIPTSVKRRLGLDGERSWVVLSEWNEFTWPGPDLRPLAHGVAASVAYGVLPPALFDTIRDRFMEIARARGAGRVQRTE